MDKWKNIRHFSFSKANDYNPNDFVFLVYAIDLPNSFFNDFHLNVVLNNFGGNYDSSQKIDLTLTPERISEKELISCSLVAKCGDSEILETYKSFGFIIKCPTENIIYASRSDLGVLYTHPDAVRQKYKDKVIPAFEDIIPTRSTDPEFLTRLLQYLKEDENSALEEDMHVLSEWTEVLVDANTIYGKVEIDGIFVNLRHPSMDDDNYAQTVIREAKKLEQRLGVPLVYFPRKKLSIKDKPIEIIYESYFGEQPSLKEIIFNKNGKKFRLYVGLSDTPVLQSSTTELMKPMSREDFEIFMDEIQKLPPKELLKHADLIRRLPQIFESQKLPVEESSNAVDDESMNDSYYKIDESVSFFKFKNR